MQFFLRKLHSICGILIIGIFLIFHLVYPGINVFKKGFLAAFILFSLPLVFHSLYGLFIIYEGKIQLYRYFRNWQYIFQRLTGLIILIFIPLHIYINEFRHGLIYNHFYSFIWVIGILASVYHLSNGLFGFLVHFGIIIGPKSQHICSVFTIIMFLFLSIIGLNAFSSLTGQLVIFNSFYKLIFN